MATETLKQGDRVRYTRATCPAPDTETAFGTVMTRNRIGASAVEYKVLYKVSPDRGEPFWIPEGALTLERVA